MATNPVVRVKIVGLNPNDKPKLTYNGQVYALNCVESNVYENIITKPIWEILMTSTHEESLNEGDVVKYIIKVIKLIKIK